ncbi:MAG: putative permease, partial [Bacteroidia bacterium]
MLEIFQKWYKRYLFEEESVLLLVLVVIAVALLMTIGNTLAPLLAAIVLAFLMQGLTNRLQNLGLPQWLGVAVAFIVFIGFFFGVSLGLLPLAWRQTLSLLGEMPRWLDEGQQLLDVLPERYPEVFSSDQVNEIIGLAQVELAGLGQAVVTH